MAVNSVYTGPLKDAELKVWDRLEVEFFEKDSSGIYVARIDDITAEGIVVDRPEWVSGEPLFAVGAKCLIRYVRPTCVLQFASVIIRSLTASNRQQFILAPPQVIKKIQRRKYVRVDVSLPFRFKLITEISSGRKKFDEVEWSEAKTRNLSAGGIGFAWTREIKQGTACALRLQISGQQLDVKTLGIVARCIQETEGCWLVGVEMLSSNEIQRRLKSINTAGIPTSFQQFTDKTRNALVNFVFREEVNIRRREML